MGFSVLVVVSHDLEEVCGCVDRWCLPAASHAKLDLLSAVCVDSWMNLVLLSSRPKLYSMLPQVVNHKGGQCLVVSSCL